MWFHRLLKSERKPETTAEREMLTMVAITSREGFTEQTCPAVRLIIDAARPDFVDYSPTGNFLVCFEADNSNGASDLVANIRKLRHRHEGFRSIGAAQVTGQVIIERDSDRIHSRPLGESVNDVFRLAFTDQSAG